MSNEQSKIANEPFWEKGLTATPVEWPVAGKRLDLRQDSDDSTFNAPEHKSKQAMTFKRTAILVTAGSMIIAYGILLALHYGKDTRQAEIEQIRAILLDELVRNGQVDFRLETSKKILAIKDKQELVDEAFGDVDSVFGRSKYYVQSFRDYPISMMVSKETGEILQIVLDSK